MSLRLTSPEDTVNQKQTKALVDLASRFLQRAGSYLDQASACSGSTSPSNALDGEILDGPVGGFGREFSRRLQRQTGKLARLIDEAKNSDDERYYELASGILDKVEEIRGILEAAGQHDEKLASIVAAARNSAALIDAVKTSRRNTGQWEAV